jgi:hypothetical protein
MTKPAGLIAAAGFVDLCWNVWPYAFFAFAALAFFFAGFFGRVLPNEPA